jgi:tetrahydromethanopterin S-methyltransferase subunit G
VTDENGGDRAAHCGFLGITLRTPASSAAATCGTHLCWTTFEGSNTMPLNAQQRFAMHVGLKQALGDEVADMLIDDLSGGDFERIDNRLSGVESRLATVDQRLDKVEQRLDKVEQRLDKVDDKLDSYFRWTIGLSVTTILTVVIMSVQLNLAIASIAR